IRDRHFIKKIHCKVCRNLIPYVQERLNQKAKDLNPNSPSFKQSLDNRSVQLNVKQQPEPVIPVTVTPQVTQAEK
ncbi:MAG: hypothetical protein ACLP0A_04505, partial [Verrucomicrobiia bacterium]